MAMQMSVVNRGTFQRMLPSLSVILIPLKVLTFALFGAMIPEVRQAVPLSTTNSTRVASLPSCQISGFSIENQVNSSQKPLCVGLI